MENTSGPTTFEGLIDSISERLSLAIGELAYYKEMESSPGTPQEKADIARNKALVEFNKELLERVFGLLNTD